MKAGRKKASDRRPRASGYVWLESGMRCFRWHGRYDPRGYVPQRGYAAVADLIEHHPLTGAFLGESQWWMFLKPKQNESKEIKWLR